MPAPACIRRWSAVGFATVIALASGCKPEPDVRAYTVPKEPKPKAAAPEPTGPDKERTLGVVIPADDKFSLFVKLRGPIDALAPLEQDFDAFVGSIKLTGADKPPTWTAPPTATWREGPAKQFRIVTFQTGPADKPTEMVLSGPFSGSLLDNVNRWRGELGLRDIAAGELADVTKEIPVGTTKAVRVDLRGPGGKGGGMMAPPFAK